MPAELFPPTPAHLAPGAIDALVDPEFVTVAGDFHAEHGWGRRVVREAQRAGSQVVVQAGDFGAWPWARRFLDEVDTWCARTGIPVLFVDGNHEDHEWLEQLATDPVTGLRPVRPWIAHVPRGHRWVWRGLTWMGLGGAVSVNRRDCTPGVDWFAQEEITYGQALSAIAGGTADVMVTHDAPAGVQIPDLPDGGWPQDALYAAALHRRQLREVVDAVRPTHLFHGHYHTRYTAGLALEGDLVCEVVGLHRDGSMAKGWTHLDLDILLAESVAARAA